MIKKILIYWFGSYRVCTFRRFQFDFRKRGREKGMGFNTIHFKREENVYYWQILSLKISFSNWQIVSMLFIFILNEVSDMVLVCFP